jgi:hypothetical protein
MAFGVRGNTQADNANKVTVDWKALNEYVVETAGLQQEETMVGIISGLYDVGVQEQEDAKMEWKGTPEEEADEIAKNSATYFEDLYDYEDKKTKRYKRWPQRPVQQVVFAIDFPEIMLDKGKFFGNDKVEAKPLRLLLGGEFTKTGGTKIAAKPLALTIRKNDKTGNKWSFTPNSTMHKMAVGSKLISKDDAFLPQDIDKLLGKALQFKVRVYFNADGYYTEKCAFVAGLGRSQLVPEFDESLLHIVQFDADNAEAYLKQLRVSVRNTMAQASDYVGSKLEAQLNKLFPNSRANTNAPQQSAEAPNAEGNTPVAAKVKAAPKASAEPTIDVDMDEPF